MYFAVWLRDLILAYYLALYLVIDSYEVHTYINIDWKEITRQLKFDVYFVVSVRVPFKGHENEQDYIGEYMYFAFW